MAESSIESQITLQPPTSQSLANLQTLAQARAELEARLVNINNDLQITQNIGLLLVKRQHDLRSVFEQLPQEGELLDGSTSTEPETGAQPLPEVFREQLVALDREFQESQNGVIGLKKLIDAQLPTTETNASSTPLPGSALGPSALPSSALPTQTVLKPRRHKAAMPSGSSINDASLPLQIQEELLTQVRYWTSQAEMKEKMNQEFDQKFQEQERIIEVLQKQRRLRDEADEKQKEDQWNTELQNQELRNQNNDLQAQLSKMTHEHAKVQSAYIAATELTEQLKDKEEKTAKQMEVAKSKHDQELATSRKHVSGLQRDKTELLTKVDDLATAMTSLQQKLSRKTVQEAIAHQQELEELEKEKEESANAPPVLIQSSAKALTVDDTTATTAAPIVAPATPEAKATSLARETSFAHQQSIINDLQIKLNKEVTEKKELITQKEELLGEKEELMNEKEELVKMLADREETIETLRFEGMGAFEPEPISKSAATLGGLGSNLGLQTGGLFAELNQATSASNSKPTVEYKDQEVMTEPIESWIHSVPEVSDLLKNTATKTDASTETVSEKPAEQNGTITGKPGMETKRIDVLDSISSSSEDDQGPSDEAHLDKPKRRSKPAVPIDEERRHTCDLSQAIAPTQDDAEDREFRVSFGSAFGGDPSATDTGRIRSIHMNNDNGDNNTEAAEKHATSTSAKQPSDGGTSPVLVKVEKNQDVSSQRPTD
ncbi:hypothetical protein BGZ65_006707, partial [Modicella reniformis]